MKIKSILVLSALMMYSCDDDTEDPISVDDTAVEFNIEKLDVLSLGDSDQSQPELVRFVSATEGVVVNSKQNSIDFITIDGTNLVLTGDKVQITDDPNAECSSIDVNVNETIIAVVATKGACDRGELYLVDAMTKEKYGPYELGYNPDAVDISVDDKFVVVVNEFDYEDGVVGGCESVAGPGVSIYNIENGLDSAVLVKDMKITHTGANGGLAEPEGVKIAPDGETVYMTLQESNEIGWFSLNSPPDTLQNKVAYSADGHEPDGIWVSADGGIICTGGEYDGKIGIHTVDIATGEITSQNYANLALDLPQDWDWVDDRKGIEPEEVVIEEYNGEMFVLATLQDPSAVVVYNITDPTNPVYDSGVITQLIDYTVDDTASSTGECEGLAVRDGYVLVANTEDPSVALLKSSWAQ
ncbi:MAG: hypothetical protein CMF80_03100 [Candidatus Marinimicrobia bacterium]|nr:hypothetical protein [Candidatus Neomarinimicrobiota bacterium]